MRSTLLHSKIRLDPGSEILSLRGDSGETEDTDSADIDQAGHCLDETVLAPLLENHGLDLAFEPWDSWRPEESDLQDRWMLSQ